MTYVLPVLRLARHYPRAKANPDGTPTPAAFEARGANGPLPVETYLSTELVEHFHPSNRNTQLAGVRQELGKRRALKHNDWISMFNVGEARRRCESSGHAIIIRLAGDDPNHPSHVGIYGNFDDHNGDISTILATQVLHRVCPAV